MYEYNPAYAPVFVIIFLLLIGVIFTVLRFRKAKSVVLHPDFFMPPAQDQSVHEPKALNILGLSKDAFQNRFEPVVEPIFVYTQMAIFSACTGGITIYRGGAVILYGICAGDITIHKGGGVIVYGSVVGNIINKGGELHLLGKHVGNLDNIAE